MGLLTSKQKKVNPRIKEWGKTTTGLTVWLVCGPTIRRDLDVEFTDGGHGLRFSFIPKSEVWIESEGTVKERQFVLVHELYEHKLMARGLGYEDAHQQASNRELEARKYPNELKGFLDMEGWC